LSGNSYVVLAGISLWPRESEQEEKEIEVYVHQKAGNGCFGKQK
jgi:hypothetical protein